MQSDDQDMKSDSNLPPNATFHPLFDLPDGDVILVSCPIEAPVQTSDSDSETKDNESESATILDSESPNAGSQVCFRLHSFTLKTTCGFFRSMFNLPQKQAKNTPETLYLTEDAVTLEYLFRMICGLPLLPLEDCDIVDTLLSAIEKYDCPGPMSIVRLICGSQSFSSHPLWLYSISCRFGWLREAKLASTLSLRYNLLDPSFRPYLQRLSTTAILDLITLHRARRDGLYLRLSEPPFVAAVSAAPCSQCSRTIVYHTWRELKYRILIEMDARPLGDTIVDAGLLQWPEAVACWDAQCPCNRPFYDKEETIRVIGTSIQELPHEV